ncbi:hypothetical protein [Salisediminibacterium beveridgei]|uniref:Uncharacterized protein n=1 Tax=Salisediminibacterium beveridgei TaxID=632773 RepID=A0A1D7QSR8_9BACI|nr:hypothetical protein [Salisediminibacterium beveridgei]AOM82064.1 hypothetical protein BBEV_0692 [Salisediminibacterium beveridgei]
MNKDQFFSMDPHVRVKKINKLMENNSLEEVAESIGVARSSFSKEMQKEDYVYIKRYNQFFRFVRDQDASPSFNQVNQNETMQFIEDHKKDFERLFLNMRGKRVDIDPTIYDNNTKVITKSIRIREHVYQDFQTFCQSNWPQFNVQDLLAQSLIEFMHKKQNDTDEKVT